MLGTLSEVEGSSEVEKEQTAMIEGLKLTMTGEEIRNILRDRIEGHRCSASRWREDAERSDDECSDITVCLPKEMCENAAEAAEWRAERLEFIREHIDHSEVYRLGSGDLNFGELLPPQPASMELAAD